MMFMQLQNKTHHFLSYIIFIANFSDFNCNYFVIRSNTIRRAWVGPQGHDSRILIGCAGDWWINHRKYYWVMPYSRVANTVTMVTVILHVWLAIKIQIL